MTSLTSHELDEFANALQLSITTKIIGVASKDGGVEISFESRPRPADKNLRNVLKLFKGKWTSDGMIFVIHEAEKITWPQITLFLLLTRMNEKNIAKLVQMDESARKTAEKLGFKCPSAGVESVKKCSEIIFEKMRKKKMTIRELSELTGFTQVSICNFKAGKDIKLSNLIKIIMALGAKLRVG